MSGRTRDALGAEQQAPPLPPRGLGAGARPLPGAVQPAQYAQQRHCQPQPPDPQRPPLQYSAGAQNTSPAMSWQHDPQEAGAFRWRRLPTPPLASFPNVNIAAARCVCSVLRIGNDAVDLFSPERPLSCSFEKEASGARAA